MVCLGFLQKVHHKKSQESLSLEVLSLAAFLSSLRPRLGPLNAINANFSIGAMSSITPLHPFSARIREIISFREGSSSLPRI